MLFKGRLCKTDKQGDVVPTEQYEKLKKLVSDFKADFLILDTLARFSGVDENDNSAMTSFCGLLEEIIEEFNCNIILIHHNNKTIGDLAFTENQLKTALTQPAIRGASALAGAVRWALLMISLSSDLAVKVIGSEAKGKSPGSYVAVKVAKKNAGKSEEVLYLEHGEHGIFYPISAKNAVDLERDKETIEDAHMLAAEVDRRLQANEARLNFSNGGQAAFDWSIRQSCAATKMAIELGLLIKCKKKERGGGYYLALPHEGEVEE